MPIWRRPSEDEIIIAHVSDPHFGSKRQEECWQVISQHIRTAVRPNLLLVTGDLVDWPSRELYKAAKNALDSLGSDYYVCAGNHDRHIKGNVSRRLASILGRRDTQALFDQTFVNQLLTPVNILTKTLTQRQTIFKVGLVGVDSSLLADYFARGYVAANDFAQLRQVIEREEGKQDFIIVLVHHHLQPIRKLEEKLRNTPRGLTNVTSMINSGSFLENLAGAGVDLVLHGHEHTPHWARYGSLEGGRGEVAIIGAGSATGNDSLKGCSLDKLSFNLVILSPDSSAKLQVLEYAGGQWRSEEIQIFDSKAGKRLRLLRRARNLTSGLSSRITKYEEFTTGRDVLVHFVFTNWYFPEASFEDGVTTNTGEPENPSVVITNASGMTVQIPVIFRPHPRKDHTWRVWGGVPDDFRRGPVRYEFSYNLGGAALLTSQEMKPIQRAGGAGLLHERGLEFASLHASDLPLESAQLIVVLPPEFAPEDGLHVKVYDEDEKDQGQEAQNLTRSILRLAPGAYSLTVPYPRENWLYALAWSPVEAPVAQRTSPMPQVSVPTIASELPESPDLDSVFPKRGIPFAQRPIDTPEEDTRTPDVENSEKGR